MFYFLFLSNLNKVSQRVLSGEVNRILIPTFNFTHPSSVTLKDYNTWFSQYGGSFPANLTQCDLEKEMQKVLLALLDFIPLEEHCIKPNINALVCSGGRGHRLSLYCLHRSHVAPARQPLLVSALLPHVAQFGTEHHVWNDGGDPRSTHRPLQNSGQ